MIMHQDSTMDKQTVHQTFEFFVPRRRSSGAPKFHGYHCGYTSHFQTKTTPIGSMYGIFTYMWDIYGINVAKYSIHGASGIWDMLFFLHPMPYLMNHHDYELIDGLEIGTLSSSNRLSVE